MTCTFVKINSVFLVGVVSVLLPTGGGSLWLYLENVKSWAYYYYQIIIINKKLQQIWFSLVKATELLLSLANLPCSRGIRIIDTIHTECITHKKKHKFHNFFNTPGSPFSRKITKSQKLWYKVCVFFYVLFIYKKHLLRE